MPESKHRRKGQSRPRPTRNAPPVKRPAPSPAWVPVVGTTLLVLGVVVIIAGYLPAVGRLTSGWGLLGLRANWPLVIGFLFLTGGFGVLTRWR